jgi:hypothetical protein
MCWAAVWTLSLRSGSFSKKETEHRGRHLAFQHLVVFTRVGERGGGETEVYFARTLFLKTLGCMHDEMCWPKLLFTGKQSMCMITMIMGEYCICTPLYLRGNFVTPHFLGLGGFFLSEMPWARKNLYPHFYIVLSHGIWGSSYQHFPGLGGVYISIS